MNVPRFADPQELTNNNSVVTQDVVWRTYRERWMIGTNGGDRESSIPAARRTDDDMPSNQEVVSAIK